MNSPKPPTILGFILLLSLEVVSMSIEIILHKITLQIEARYNLRGFSKSAIVIIYQAVAGSLLTF